MVLVSSPVLFSGSTLNLMPSISPTSSSGFRGGEDPDSAFSDLSAAVLAIVRRDTLHGRMFRRELVARLCSGEGAFGRSSEGALRNCRIAQFKLVFVAMMISVGIVCQLYRVLLL
jgi:hypothetical protein